MKNMKWILWIGSGALVIGAAAVLITKQINKNEEPTVSTRTVAEQRLEEKVLNNPERYLATKEDTEEFLLTAKNTENIETKVFVSQEVPRQLLSEVKRETPEKKEREPVHIDSLYYRKSYASLRKDEIRNPDSPENRAGVVSLMEARQRRLGQTAE